MTGASWADLESVGRPVGKGWNSWAQAEAAVHGQDFSFTREPYWAPKAFQLTGPGSPCY